MKTRITPKQVFKQVKADLIGKDSHRGVTLTYSWMANQFGHISLGFIPTLLACTLLKNILLIQNIEFWSATMVSVMWLLFEAYNFLGPLLLHREPVLTNTEGTPSNRQYVFKPDWNNIAFDTITDLCFFWFGAFSAAVLLEPTMMNVSIVMLLAVVLVHPCRFWFLTKMYLQLARYPVQFRLSQWNAPISKNNEKKVFEFLGNSSNGNHLLIFETNRNRVPSLGVAIATEKSIRHTACTYTTATKLYRMFYGDEAAPDNELAWTWRDSDLLIIDDITPGNPVPLELIQPEEFLAIMDIGCGRSNENRTALVEKNVIWIFGANERQVEKNWHKMLLKMGVPNKKIATIRL